MIEVVLFAIWFLAVVLFLGYVLSYRTDKLDRLMRWFYEHN